MPIRSKAVIFDYGNVLTEPQNDSEIEGMASALDLSRAQFEKAYWRFRVAYDEAQLDPRQYWDAVGNTTARTISDSQRSKLIELDSLSWMYPRTVISDWASALSRAGFPTALLSNMPVTLRDALARCTWLPSFQHRTLSCDVKQSKPSPEIYLHCLSGLSLAPSEVLFLDDREPNVQAARDLGMHALQFTTPDRLAAELERSFYIPVRLAAKVERTHEQNE